jgi:hypothetical protein
MSELESTGKKKAVNKTAFKIRKDITQLFQLSRFRDKPLKVSNIVAVEIAIRNATNCRTPKVVFLL